MATIDLNMSVREIMRRFRGTRQVFDQYGLFGCGGPEGPAEPLSLFARVHQMDAEQLLSQLREAASACEASPAEMPAVSATSSQSRVPLGMAGTQHDPRIWPRIFIRTASLAFVSVGALTGAVYLSLISYYGTFEMAKLWPGWTAHVQSHGHVQLSGWVTLFIMGIAYFAIPRFLAIDLPQTSIVRASYGLMMAGIVLRILYQPFSAERWAANMVFLGAVAEFAAAIIFLRLVFRAGRLSAKRREPYTDYLKWGTVWLLVSQAILLAHAAASLVQGREVLLSRATDETYLHTMLMGFVGLFILGMTLRTVPLMLNFSQQAGEALQHRVLTGWNLGVWLFAAGQLSRLVSATSGKWWVLAGASLELFSGLAFLAAVNPFQKPRASLQDDSSPVWIWLIRAAYCWFAVALVMGVILSSSPLLGASVAQPYWGAFRHALTVGWVSMMIFGMAYRMIPVMEGRALSMAWTAPVVFWLVNVGALGRVGLQSLSVTVPGVLPWMAPTGFLELTAGVFFTLSIWKTTAIPKTTLQADGERTQPDLMPGAIGSDRVVGKVLRAFPTSLEIFVRHGFTALKNPVLRAAAANMVTIAQACRMHGIDLESLLRDLNSQSEPAVRTEPLNPAEKVKSEQLPLVQLAPAPATTQATVERKKLEQNVWSILAGLEDPEFPGISVVDLGLIYGVAVPTNEEVTVRMTLTSRGCPASKMITDAVRKRVEYNTSARCRVELVWEPAWTPDRITPAGKEFWRFRTGAAKPSSC